MSRISWQPFYIYDMMYMARGETFIEANEKLKNFLMRLGSILEWAKEHNIKFEFDKCTVVGYTRNREKNAVPPAGIQRQNHTDNQVI